MEQEEKFEYVADPSAKSSRQVGVIVFCLFAALRMWSFGGFMPIWEWVSFVLFSVFFAMLSHWLGMHLFLLTLLREDCECEEEVIEVPVPIAPKRNLLAFNSPAEETLIQQRKVSRDVDLFEVFAQENHDGLIDVAELIKRTEMLKRRNDKLSLKRPSVKGVDLEDTELNDLGDASLYGIVQNGTGNKNYSNFLNKMRDAGFVTGSSNYPRLTDRYYAYCTKVCFENGW